MRILKEYELEICLWVRKSGMKLFSTEIPIEYSKHTHTHATFSFYISFFSQVWFGSG